MVETHDEQMCGDMKAEEAVENYMGLIINTTKDLYYEFKYPVPTMNDEERGHGANIPNRVPLRARTVNERMKCDFEDVRQLVSISFIEDICRKYDPNRGAHLAYFAKRYLKRNARRWVRRECVGDSDTELAQYQKYIKVIKDPEEGSKDEKIKKEYCLLNLCLDQCEFTDKEKEVLYLMYDMDFVNKHGLPRKQKEIAEILGLTDGRISQRMQNIRAKLNACIVELDKKGVC